MNFDDYQKRAKKTKIYPVEEIIRYPALGLAGECGEVCEIIKKYTRDNLWNPDLEDDIKQFDKMTAKVELELGDVLWYVANCYVKWHSIFDAFLSLNCGDLALRVHSCSK